MTATALASTLSLGPVQAVEPACPPAEPKQKPAHTCPAPSAKKQAAKKTPAKKQAAKKQAAKKTPAKKTAAKKKTPKQQATQQQAAKKQAARKQAARKQAARKQAARKQAAKKLAARKQAAKKQAARKQSPQAPSAACRPPRPKPAATCQSAPKKPAAKHPAAKKPAAKQPAAKKPAAKKPTGQRPPAKRPPTKKPPAKKRQLKKDHGWSWEGLYIDAADLRKVNVFLARARKAERTISPQVRSIARRTNATVVGFNDRLRTPEAVKRSIARDMQDNPTETADEALEKINDSVRYILQWPDASYVKGVNDTTKLLGQWKNANLRWSNTWARARGYKGINTAWRANNSGHPYELQFHTPKSRAAQNRSRKLYEEAHSPRTGSARRAQLQGQMNRIYNTVPCPAGSQLLNGPRRRSVERPT
ncbi:histone H1-like repetitive region-containing protein [Streptomyces sp. CB02923]|uniref:histone H1-like repetitive region-containing protein n=1 Tax=Streptomyces sp. CB02923 TaxID=1718985 RepID=UPI0009398B56|nr:histone H1-like repetitive region-containing protein [Streptomyces sp. CB02923]